MKIDYFITTAGHGKCLVDSLAGTDKAWLANGYIDGMDPARIDENGKSMSEAEKAYRFLSHPSRPLGDSKHKVAEDATYITTRKYVVSNYSPDDPIPLQNCNWVADGFPKKEKKSGFSEMFHFRYDYRFPESNFLARRVPCICQSCLTCLDLEWDTTKQWQEQPMVQRPEDCYFASTVDDLNDWNFCELKRSKHSDVEEINLVYQDALAYKSNQEMAKIKVDGFGAIGMEDDPDGFLLVQWKTLPYTTQEPTLTFGNNEPIPAGEVFAEATIWERIPSVDNASSHLPYKFHTYA